MIFLFVVLIAQTFSLKEMFTPDWGERGYQKKFQRKHTTMEFHWKDKKFFWGISPNKKFITSTAKKTKFPFTKNLTKLGSENV
jgi:hypothetical protein